MEYTLFILLRIQFLLHLTSHLSRLDWQMKVKYWICIQTGKPCNLRPMYLMMNIPMFPDISML